MATYTVDKIGYNNNEYVLQDSGALQLTGGSVTGPVTFGDSVSADDVSIGTLSVTGGATFANNIQANKINNVTVGSSPKFTDTVTTVTTTGSGNAITAITASNGVITATKGTTFPTSNTDTTYTLSNALSSHKFTSTLTAGGSGSGTSTASIELVAGTGITLTDDTTNKKITIASSVTNTDTKVQVAEVTSGTTYYPLVGTGTTAATRQYDTTGLIYKGTNGTTSAVGYSTLTLGNNKASGTANNKQGQLVIYGSTAYTHTIQGAPTANRTLTLPNATGTIALTSDIPSVPDVSGKIDTAGTGLSKSGTTLNHSNSVAAQSTQAVYPIKIDAQGHISAYGSAVTIPSVTLNGSSSTSPSFYAPTSAGTSGYYLKSSGSGAPTWTAFPTIPTVPSAGTTATAVGTSSSGGSATTWSKSDHVHNITSTTITTALGYTPYNSTNPNGYTSNTGTVTGVKVNGTTINPTSGVVDIGTVAASDTKVTQNVISSDDANSYPLLVSASTDGSTATTETALKCGSLTFIRNDDNANALSIGAGRVILGRVHFNSNETTRSSGTGIGIGTGDSSDSELFYRTAGSGQFLMQHYTAAKNSDGTIPSGVYRDSIINMNTSANNPTIYLYNKSGADTVTSYLRLNANSLYIHDESAHQLGAGGIDKINNFAKAYQVSTTGSAVSLNNTNFNVMQSFKITETGTYLIAVTGMFPAIASSAVKIVRLTSNTSTDAISAACEATLPSTVTGNLNKASFTAIVNFTAGATYRIQMKTTSATNGSGYSAYGYVRLL